MQCEKCRREVFLPFRCPYCGGYFCSEHRLPENHECPQMEKARTPAWTKSPTIVIQKQEPHEYSVTYVPVEPARKSKIYFSKKEIQHLAIAALLVTGIALSLAISPDFRITIMEPIIFTALAATVVVSFFAHELAHKIAAQRSGYWAEFRLTLMGTILTLISIISPFFKVISPGAVVISGFAGKETLGKFRLLDPQPTLLWQRYFWLAISLVLTAYWR